MSRIRSQCGVLLLAALAVPAPAHAQIRDAVVRHLVGLTNALGGAFGDEGADVTRNMQEVEAALAQWDSSIARAERGFAADMPAASPEVAAEMLAALGSIYVQRGRLADGIRQLSASLGLPSPRRRGTTVQLLAAAQRAAGRVTDAAETLRREWGRNPGDPAIAALMSEAGAARPDELPAMLDALLSAALPDSPLAGAAAPFLSLALVDDDRADEPVFPPARYAAGYARFAIGDFAEGLRLVRDAAAADPLVAHSSSEPADLREGIAALRRGDLEGAVSRLRTAVASAASLSEAHRALGAAYWADGRLADARAAFSAAIELNAADERAYVALSGVLREDGDTAAAGRTLERAAAAIPQSGQVHWLLARDYERQHLDDRAIEEYRLALRDGAPVVGAAQIHAAIGRLLHSRLDLEAATAAYEQRVAAAPNSASAHRSLAEVLQARDLHERAVVECLTAHLLNRADAVSLSAAAQSFLALNRDADAERAATRALALDPRNVQARYALAVVLPRRGRPEEGQRQLEAYRIEQEAALVAQRRVMEINGLKLQAEVRTQAGDHAAAAAAWQQAIALEGRAPDSLIQLARALGAANEVDRAAVAYADAVRLRRDPAVQRELVTLLERAGRDAQAATARAEYEQMKRERLQALGAVR